jgi:hypothetical protein
MPQLRRVEEFALRSCRRAGHRAVADLDAGQQLGDPMQIRAAIARVQRLGSAQNNVQLIIAERDRSRHVTSPGNKLGQDERAWLLKRWRDAFEQAQPEGFVHCIGCLPGDTFATWLMGDEARQSHYAWAGIPRHLVRRWTRERRRRQARPAALAS